MRVKGVRGAGVAGEGVEVDGSQGGDADRATELSDAGEDATGGAG